MRERVTNGWLKPIHLIAVLLLAAAMVTATATFTGATAAKAGTAPSAPAYATAAPAALATAGATGAQANVNKKGAVSWALANWKGGYNGFGDDCTDFVSRALAYGGGDPEKLDPNGGSTSNDHYWYFLTAKYIRWWSHSWSVAKDLAVHLNLIGSYWLKYWNNAKPGDIIFANWSGNKFSGISHVGIITKMSHGVPLITQHSPRQKNISLNYWLKNGGRDVHVWIASPNAG